MPNAFVVLPETCRAFHAIGKTASAEGKGHERLLLGNGYLPRRQVSTRSIRGC
jgi:hypothetical protein